MNDKDDLSKHSTKELEDLLIPSNENKKVQEELTRRYRDYYLEKISR